MDKLQGAARHAFGLQQRTDELPTTSSYNYVDRDESKDSERLLASPSPSPSGESELTACEKNRDACDCLCHQRQQPQRLTMPAQIHLFASMFWLLGVLLIVLVFRRDNSHMPANGTFGWCK